MQMEHQIVWVEQMVLQIGQAQRGVDQYQPKVYQTSK